MHELERHIAKLNPGSLAELNNFISGTRESAGEDLQAWEAELNKNPSMRRILGGALLGAMIGLPTGPAGVVGGAIAVPTIDYASEKQAASWNLKSMEAFLTAAPQLEIAIQKRLTQLNKSAI